MSGLYTLWAAACECGHEFTAGELHAYNQRADEGWPIVCTAALARSKLIHPGCGGRVAISVEPYADGAVERRTGLICDPGHLERRFSATKSILTNRQRA